MKLNKKQVKTIRDRFRRGVTVTKLAQDYSVGCCAISNVVWNRCHYDETYKPPVEPAFDVEFARSLRSKKKKTTLHEIAVAEARKHNRKRPYSSTTVRTYLSESKSCTK